MFVVVWVGLPSPKFHKYWLIVAFELNWFIVAMRFVVITVAVTVLPLEVVTEVICGTCPMLIGCERRLYELLPSFNVSVKVEFPRIFGTYKPALLSDRLWYPEVVNVAGVCATLYNEFIAVVP